MIKKKNDFLKSLDQIKIILGNGFDLHCKLKTSYNDFFNYKKILIQNIINWTENVPSNYLKDYLIENPNNLEISLQIPKEMYNSSIWYIFFTLCKNDSQENNWSDIEKEMQDSFSLNIYNSGKTFWENVFVLISQNIDEIIKARKNIDIFAVFMINKYPEICKIIHLKQKKELFYQLLLKELESFEKDFAHYIENIIKISTIYYNNVNITLNALSSNKLKIISIESFNFTNLDSYLYNNYFDQKSHIFYNINGTTDNPIFGIDSEKIKTIDAAYIFTKTSRRLIQNMIKNDINEVESFKNIIIYGHSLDKQDFNYFFPIFDYLKLDDASSNTHIIFAYSDYESKSKEEIERIQMKNISYILEEYEEYIYPKRKQKRLLDSLSTEGRIILLKI
ncbi:MAG: AbiH family protein [Fusobacterium sp.]